MNNDVRQAQQRRVATAGANHLLYLVIVIAVAIVVNAILSLSSPRLDLTADKRFTLADATRDLIRGLDGPVEIYAFISSDLPEPYATMAREAEDLLSDYEAHSGGHVTYRLIDPDADDGATDVGEESGARTLAANLAIQPVTIVDESRNQVSFREVFMGLAIVYQAADADRTDVIEQLYPGMNLEYELTRRIRALVVGDDVPTLGFVVGDGSFLDRVIEAQSQQSNPMVPPPDPDTVRDELAAQLKTQLFDDLFDVTFVDLADEIPDEVSGLIVMGPTEPLSDDALRRLDAFVMAGNGVAFMVSPYILQPLEVQGVPGAPPVLVPARNEADLDRLFAAYGVTLNDDMVIDREAAQVSVAMETVAYMGDLPVQQPVPVTDPRLPVLTEINREAIVTASLPLLAFMPSDRSQVVATSTLTLSPPAAGMTVTEVVATNPASMRLRDTDTLTFEEAALGELDGDVGSYTVAATLEGTIPSAFGDDVAAPGARILVVSNGEFVANVFNQADPLRDPRFRRSLPPAVAQSVDAYGTSTVLFIKNVADWLVQDGDLVAIRGRGMPTFIETRHLAHGRRLAFQVFNIAIVPALVGLAGALMWWRRRRRRGAIADRFSQGGDR